MSEDKKFLEPLTPIILNATQKELQSYANYEKALDEAFTCDDISNIALTGPYGAGKSTIMQTYEAEHDKKYIHISLAKFGDETDPAKGNFTQRELEIKIINQIIHQISEKSIPQTKFHTKKEIGDGKILLYSVLIFLLIASLWYLFVVPSAMWNSTAVSTLYESFIADTRNFFVLFIALISLFALIFFIVKRQMISPLIKAIQVDKSKIELSDESKDTDEHQFNRYMDELIYIFINGKIDALVLDDIDRFGQLEVFSELREMNYLINKKMQLMLDAKGKSIKDRFCKKKSETENVRRIKFFYMVKDELFSDFEQRTKFFDLIIPIVPAMDSSNSFELLKELMTNDGELSEEMKNLDMKYVQMICLDIHDYRVLKNIYNEYKFFYKQLRVPQLQLSATKLFAMITYKNLWPEDYAQLQRKKGWVYERLESVTAWQENKIVALQKEIQELEEQMMEVEKENLLALEDLDCIYFKNPSGCQNGGYFSINGKSQWTYASNKEFLKALRETDFVTWNWMDYSRGHQSKKYTKSDIQKWFEELMSNKEYAKRKETIERKNAEWIRKRQREIEEKRKEIGQIELTSLSQILSEDKQEMESLFSVKSLEGKKEIDIAIKRLVSTFLKDGMIEDDYQSYMTYFYPYSLTADEIAYLNCVRAGEKEKSADFEIKNHKLVIEHLREQDYQSNAIPNYSLLQYALLQNITKITESIYNKLKVEQRMEFIIKFCNRYPGYTLYGLLEYWPDLLNDIFKDADIPWVDKKKVLLHMLQFPLKEKNMLDEENLDLLWDNEVELIRECSIEQLKNYTEMGLLIENLTSPDITEEKRKIICDANCFLCNKENIEYILQRESHRKEEVVLNILNDVAMPFEEKEQLIDVMKGVVIKNISKVLRQNEPNKDDLWTLLLKADKVAFNPENIVTIWKEEENFSDVLFGFLKQHFAKGKCGLSYKKIKELFGEPDLALKFLEEIFMFQDFGKGYEYLLKDLNIYYDNFDFEKVNKQNLEIIIRKTNIIKMNERHLVKIRNDYSSDVLADWITGQIGLYATLMKEEKLQEETELQMIIYDERVSETLKCTLIPFCKTPIAIADSYNSVVVEKILKTDNYAGNYGVLYNRYNAQQRYSKSAKKLIEDYSIRHIKEIIPLRIQIPSKILELALIDERVTQADKKLLLARQMGYLTKQVVTQMLSCLDEHEFFDVVQGKQVKVLANETNQMLLEGLVVNKWVSSYKAREDEYIVYPKLSTQTMKRNESGKGAKGK